MSKRAKVRDESSIVTRTFSRITHHGETGRRWRDGLVFTPLGVVAVYSQGFDDFDESDPYSRYDIVVRGRHYIRSEDVARTKLGLAIQAGRFIRELHRSRR